MTTPEEESPLIQAEALVNQLFRDKHITIYGKIMVKIQDYVNPRNESKPAFWYYSTETGSYLLKGELKYWILAWRYVSGIQGGGISINSDVYNKWVEKTKANLLYWYVGSPNVYYMNYEELDEKVIDGVQPFNQEPVKVISLRDVRPWT